MNTPTTSRTLALAAALAFAALGTAGCKSSLPADVDTICNCEVRSKVKTSDVREREQKISAWVNANLKTERGRQLYSSLFNLSPKNRVSKLRAEARKAGLSSCALAETWAKDSGGGDADKKGAKVP